MRGIPMFLLLPLRLDLYIALPHFGTRPQRDDQVAGARRLGFPPQPHASDIVQPIALAVVAARAGASCVRPGVFAALAARDDVINRKVALCQHSASDLRSQLDAAIDAGVVVSHQHALAAPVRFAARHIDIRSQRDDRRHGKFGAHRIQVLSRLFHRDGFARQQQVHRPRHCDDRQGLPRAAVQQQHTQLHDTCAGHCSNRLSARLPHLFWGAANEYNKVQPACRAHVS